AAAGGRSGAVVKVFDRRFGGQGNSCLDEDAQGGCGNGRAPHALSRAWAGKAPPRAHAYARGNVRFNGGSGRLRHAAWRVRREGLSARAANPVQLRLHQEKTDEV